MENRGARRESVADTRPYNEILIPPFDFDFLEKRSMEIKLLATTVRRHNKSTAYITTTQRRTKYVDYIKDPFRIFRSYTFELPFQRGILFEILALRDLYANRDARSVSSRSHEFSVYI